MIRNMYDVIIVGKSIHMGCHRVFLFLSIYIIGLLPLLSRSSIYKSPFNYTHTHVRWDCSIPAYHQNSHSLPLLAAPGCPLADIPINYEYLNYEL